MRRRGLDRDRDDHPGREPEELQLEIDTLKALDHPHIIRLFEYFEDYNNVYIIMETAKGGELLDVIESNYKSGYRLNEQWIAAVFQQVMEAISYVHSRGKQLATSTLSTPDYFFRFF